MIVVGASAGVADAILALFIALLAAKIGDEIFKRIRQPSVVGEILAGLVVGPAVLDLVAPEGTVEVFAELGVVFLLFWVGLETRISDLRAVGPVAGRVGVLGLVVPLAGGYGFGKALGEDDVTAFFIGVALVATSVGITSAVLVELNLLRRRASRTILGAAVVDDILAMVMLAVAVGLAGEGTDISQILVVIGLAVGFVAFFGLGGTAFLRRRPGLLKAPRFSESPLLPAVIVCLGLAALSSQIGLAAVIGAFLAGMIVAETKEHDPIEHEVAPLHAFFTPFFFVFVGMQLDLDVLRSWGTIGLLVGVTALAVVTKAVGAWLGARSLGRSDALFVATGMVPRGEVGIIVAGIARAEGVIDDRLFAVIVGMSIVTTLIVPPVLRHLSSGLSAEPDASSIPGPAG